MDESDGVEDSDIAASNSIGSMFSVWTRTHGQVLTIAWKIRDRQNDKK